MTDEEDKATVSLTVDDALKMYDDYKAHWSENYREAAIDLKMYSGDPYTHYGLGWDDKYTAPTGAMVVDNELPQYVHQVTNDIRQNTPSIKVVPEADGDIETAKIFAGTIRGIEYKSSADEAYDTGADYAVKCSIGFIKTDHDYCDDDEDEQELQIKSVHDPLAILNDPATVEWDGRDANGQIALEPISKKDFDKHYKGKEFISFTDPKDKDAKDSIILANIYIREFGGKRGKKATIRHYKFSGSELLAETKFPGKFCPYTPIYGEMVWIDGKRILSSLIRQARSPQRRLNHMLSKESQVLAMAPIAPIMAVEGTLVNERKQYQMPGLENALEYRQKDLDGNDAPAPTRLQPPGASTGFLEAIASAKEAIKASMGIYSAGLGKREGDASGRALQSLQHEGDVATFHFPDNVRRSINQVGRILIEAIPEIYDTPRVIQTVNEEQDVEMVGINGGPAQEGQKQKYDLTKGKYHVRVTTGASYTTKRQAEADLLGEVIKSDPELMKVFGDLWAKNLDGPGAQAMASRLRKLVPPQLLEDDKDKPQIPPQIAQEMQKMQQIIQAGAQELQQLQQQLADKNAEMQIKSREVAVKEQDVQVKAYEAQKPDIQPQDNSDQIEITKLQIQAQKDARELDLKEKQFELQVQEFQFKIAEALTQTDSENQATGQEQIEQQPNPSTQAGIVMLQAIAEQINQLNQSINTPKPITVLRADPNNPYSPITGAVA